VAQQRAHLARGEVENAAAVGVVHEAALCALDDQRLEGAAVAHQVPLGLLPERGSSLLLMWDACRSK
jgi:hypothetical protein